MIPHWQHPDRKKILTEFFESQSIAKELKTWDEIIEEVLEEHAEAWEMLADL